MDNPTNTDLPVTCERRIPVALLTLRLSVFIVMLMWTLDKFVRPEHAASVYENYYFVGGLSRAMTLTIGALEVALLGGFLLGIAKRCTYGAVLVLHGISTVSAFKHYLAPFAEGPHLLFFAAWPMLAACFSLYLLRDLDTLGLVRWGTRSPPPFGRKGPQHESDHQTHLSHPRKASARYRAIPYP